MTIAEKLAKIAQNEPKVYEAGKMSLYHALARCEKSGDTVRISDALGVEQSADVRIFGKNLISYPYATTTKTINGVTFTDNGDGTITANGTATSLATFYLNETNTFPDIVGQTVTLSGCPSGGGESTYRLRYQQSGVTSDTGGGVTFEVEAKSYLVIQIFAEQTVTNLIFKPMLELGSSATAYAPYISDLSAVKLRKYGKNLIPYPYVNTTKTMNGVTFTDNGDGSVTASGTATAEAFFTFSNEIPLKKGNYYLSGCASGGSSTTWYIQPYVDGQYQTIDDGDGAKYRWTPVNGITKLILYVKPGAVFNNLVFKPMLELGEVMTEYEPYQVPETYASDADGHIQGVTIGKGTATFITDTSGASMTVQYSSDYNAGEKSVYDTFWDNWQEQGKRSDYSRAFAGWNAAMEYFCKPKYDIRPTGSYMIFSYNRCLTDLPAWCGECGIKLDFSNNSDFTYIFHQSTITHVGTIDATKGANLVNMFNTASALQTVDKLILKADGSQNLSNAFDRCNILENLTVSGTIGKSVSFSYSPKLTVASLRSILTALTKDSTKASGKALTLTTAAQAKIQADAAAKAQYDAAIAAGWTIAFA